MKHIIYIMMAFVMLAGCVPTAAQPTESPTLPPSDQPVVSEATPNPSPDTPVEGGEDMPEQPFAPLPGDANLQRGNVFIENAELLSMESYPVQFLLSITGALPTPCHQLRVVVSPPDAENKIAVETYSVVDPNMMCTQVLKEFSQGINLGSFPAGQYEVWLNGEKIAEFIA